MKDQSKPWHKVRLKQLRKTQAQLAQLLDVDQSAVSLIFQGMRKVSAAEAVIISEFLEISLDKLLENLGVTAGRLPLMVPLSGTVQDDGAVMLEAMQVSVRACPGFETGIDLALRIATNALEPRYWPGETIFARPIDLADLWRFIGQEMIIEVEDGRRLLRVLQSGAEPETYSLADYRGNVLIGIVPAAAWRIAWHRPHTLDSDILDELS